MENILKGKSVDQIITDLLQELADELPGLRGKKYKFFLELWNSEENWNLRSKLSGEGIISLGDGAYAIRDTILPVLYLFVGEDSALLVDTGLGYPELPERIKKLTGGKPLTVTATHASPLTMGGAAYFDGVHLPKSEVPMAKWLCSPKIRKGFALLNPARLVLHNGAKVSEEKGRVVVDDASKYDLGGRTIHVIKTPGSTRGTRCFRDDMTGITVTGELLGPVAFSIFPNSPSLSEYEKSLDLLENEAGDGEKYGMWSARPLRGDREGEFHKLIDSAVSDGNSTERLVGVKIAPSRNALLLYFPWRARHRKWSEKFSKIWKN